MRIRLRPPYDEDEIAASVAPLPPALLDHDVSFDTVVRARSWSGADRQFRPATLVKLPRNTRPTWGSEAHVKLQKRPGLSLNQSTMPAQPNGYRHVVDACSRLKITPPSSCSPDRSVWISTVVKSVSFIIDPDADETRSGVLHDRPACTPEDEAPLSSAEHVHERTLAKGYVRIVMVDGEEYVWPIDVNDAGLPSGSPGLRDRLLDLVARLKDGWQDLVDACGREDADEAMTIVRERMADPPSKWPDEATAAAAELVRLARATVFETGWRRFVLPLLKGHLEPTYTIWAIRSALDGHRRKRHEILRDYASSAVLAFEALDPEFERWTARILGVVGFAEPVEEDASDVVEIEVDENVFVPIKRCRSPIDELLTPERPSKRVRSSSSPVPATSAGFETRASAPPPLPAAARLALKRRSQARLQHLDSLLQDLARADKRIKKLEAAYVSAHEDERELVHRLTVAPLQLAREKMEAKNAERQSRFDECVSAMLREWADRAQGGRGVQGDRAARGARHDPTLGPSRDACRRSASAPSRSRRPAHLVAALALAAQQVRLRYLIAWLTRTARRLGSPRRPVRLRSARRSFADRARARFSSRPRHPARLTPTTRSARRSARSVRRAKVVRLRPRRPRRATARTRTATSATMTRLRPAPRIS